MSYKKPQLRIPGPTPVAANAMLAGAKPLINHRGKEFKEKLPLILNRLKKVFCTQNLVLAITGSGTSAMEAAVSNLVIHQDPVLVLNGGSFGLRWEHICNSYGAQVHEIEYPWGEGIDPQKVKDFLHKYPQTKAVFATHNESSTGVLNDIKAIGEIISCFDALYIVDAISSLGGTPVNTDQWGIDVVCAASQKCLQTPPGLAFMSLSEKAQAQMEKVTGPRFYFDLRAYKRMLAKGEPPYTPNLTNFFALEEALDMIEAEGLENIFARHLLMRDMVRTGIQALGLPLFVEDKWASPTVTAVKPEFTDIAGFIAKVRDIYGVELAGGHGKLSGQIFRIGHMGYASPLDMLTTLAAIEICLGKYGVATAAAEQLWHRFGNGGQ